MSEKKIRLLSDHIINQIAAGEVIENPASVVKELVENSIDAGSKSICIEIMNGGRELIRISDDGSGMSKDNALLCLERHATSKISGLEDIESLLTMGFRGEAVPSIASISKFTLLTANDKEGTLITVEGGKLKSCSAAVRSTGTTIEVKSLFFNVPVRRKFQKSPSFDTQEILKIITILSIGHADIQFELVSDEKTVLKTNFLTQDNLSKRAELLLGKENSNFLTPLSFSSAGYQIEGLIGQPHLHKVNRRSQYLFINKRAVFSPLVSLAVKEGYSTLLPANRYPVFILHLAIPGEFIDVNVHPQKREVRIRQEQQMKIEIINAIQQGLKNHSSTHFFPAQDSNEVTPAFWGAPSQESAPFFSSPSFKFPNLEQTKSEDNWSFETTQEPKSEMIRPLVTPQKMLSVQNTIPNLCQPKVIATIKGYAILESFGLPHQLFNQLIKEEGGLVLLHQNAAYARIQFEHLLKTHTKEEPQSLLFPLTFQFSPQESVLLQTNLSLFNEMGFSIREFGLHTFVIDAFPTCFSEKNLEICLTEMINSLSERVEMSDLASKKEHQLALAACRSSSFGSKQLSLEEAQHLLNQLLKCDLPSQSPFGLSTLTCLSPSAIEKLF